MVETEKDYTITAVDRSLVLLEAIAENPASNVTELARYTGLTRSLVFRLIHTLAKRGYIHKSQDGRRYTLGFKVIYLSANARDQIPLLQAARPYLEEIAAKSGQNVNLIVRDGLNHLTIFGRRSPVPNNLYAAVGRRGPLYVGGAPKILLAFAPKEVRDQVLYGQLQKFTDHTVIDPVQLSATLDKIRRTGLNETTQDIDPGAFSFAAAVYDADGDVIAAISIAGPSEHLTHKDAQNYRHMVRSTSDNISKALGWQKKEHSFV